MTLFVAVRSEGSRKELKSLDNVFTIDLLHWYKR